MAPPARPTRLGPYDVIVKIAGGGMATIYLGRARDAKGTERLVALKAIRHDFRHDERFVRMFLDEAKILSRLSHPNIAAHYEFGTEGEQNFIAMELLVGRTLSDVWDACLARNLTLRISEPIGAPDPMQSPPKANEHLVSESNVSYFPTHFILE